MEEVIAIRQTQQADEVSPSAIRPQMAIFFPTDTFAFHKIRIGRPVQTRSVANEKAREDLNQLRKDYF